VLIYQWRCMECVILTYLHLARPWPVWYSLAIVVEWCHSNLSQGAWRAGIGAGSFAVQDEGDRVVKWMR
jgi:hypothetical protein